MSARKVYQIVSTNGDTDGMLAALLLCDGLQEIFIALTDLNLSPFLLL